MQELPFSAPCERNKSVIFDKLEPYFKQCSNVLEIGSGSAQHAVYFAGRQTSLEWQTSDRAEYIDGINAQCENAGLDNVRLPFILDVNVANWLPEPKHYSAIYTANTLHIMDWESVSAFFKGLAGVSVSQTFLFIYGPFKYEGDFTSPSNAEFDQLLRSRGVGSSIKDFEKIHDMANSVGFNLLKDIKMPANNQLLIWQKIKSVA